MARAISREIRWAELRDERCNWLRQCGYLLRQLCKDGAGCSECWQNSCDTTYTVGNASKYSALWTSAECQDRCFVCRISKDYQRSRFMDVFQKQPAAHFK